MDSMAFLTDAEEQVIVDLILSAQGRKLPVTKDTIMSLVSSLLSDEQNLVEVNKEGPYAFKRSGAFVPGEAWYELFMKRHPNIVTRMRESLSASSRNVNQQDVKQWFADVRSYLGENDSLDILYEAKRNFNVGELWFGVSPIASNACAATSSKKIDRITVLANFGADGSLPPPLIIFPNHRIPFAVNGSLSTRVAAIGKSESGQINNELLYEFLCNVFDEWLTDHNIQRPVIVWVDKHESQLQYHLVKRLADLQIILILIPPNTSHFMQPVDVGMLTPMKKAWEKCLKDFGASRSNGFVTKENFVTLFLPVYLHLNIISSDKIKGAFRKCGIHPYDIEAPDYSKLTLETGHASNADIFEGMEHHKNVERETQMKPVQKLNATAETPSFQSSETINSLTEDPMIPLRAKRQIISKGCGCDDAVLSCPRLEASICSKKEKWFPFMLKKNSNLNHGRANLDKESKRTAYFDGTYSTMKDKSRRTCIEKRYPFLKECFVSIERLPCELAKTDIPKYAAANNFQIKIEKDVEIKEEPIDLNFQEDPSLAPGDLVWNDETHSYPIMSCEPNLEGALMLNAAGDVGAKKLNQSTKKSDRQFSYCDVSHVGESKVFPDHIVRTASNSKTHKCTFCDASFTRRQNLKKHILSAHERLDQNPFKWPSCDYTGSLKSTLSNHISTGHELTRPFKCPACDYACSFRGNLLMHIRAVHEKLRLVFKSSPCNYTCNQRKNLGNHITTVHKKSTPLKCQPCDYECSQRKSLSKHLKSFHENVRRFMCLHCGYVCDSKSCLLTHETIVHNKLKQFNLSSCVYTSSSKVDLYNHLQLLHKKINIEKSQPIEEANQEPIKADKQEPVRPNSFISISNEDPRFGLNQGITIYNAFFGKNEDTELLTSTRPNQVRSIEHQKESTKIELKERQLESCETILQMAPNCPKLCKCPKPLCSQYFTSMESLVTHVKIHEQFKCSFCDNAYLTKNYLRTHVRSVHEKKSSVKYPNTPPTAFVPMKENL